MMNGFPGRLLAIDENGNELELQGTISIDEEPDLLSFNEEGPLSDCLITNGSLSVDITSIMKLWNYLENVTLGKMTRLVLQSKVMNYLKLMQM